MGNQRELEKKRTYNPCVQLYPKKSNFLWSIDFQVPCCRRSTKSQSVRNPKFRKKKQKEGKGRKSGGRDLHLHAGGRESANSHSLQGRAKAIVDFFFFSFGRCLINGRPCRAELSDLAGQFHS